MVAVASVVHLESLLWLQSAVRVNQCWLVEWLILVVSISVLGSNNVRMRVLFRFPAGLVEELSIVLESWRLVGWSFTCFHCVVKLNVVHTSLQVSVWLGSGFWIQISFSEGCAPLFIQGWMRFQPGFLSITSEESRSFIVESLLISFESKLLELENKIIYLPVGCPMLMSVLELLLFSKASTSYFGVSSSKFGITLWSWDETSILGNRVGLEGLWSLRQNNGEHKLKVYLLCRPCLCNWFYTCVPCSSCLSCRWIYQHLLCLQLGFCS